MFQTFSKEMGYIVNMLPKYLARLGADVHLITTDLPFHFNEKDSYTLNDRFLASASCPAGTVEQYDGYTLHVLPHQFVMGYVNMLGWKEKLRELKPDIVQALPATGLIPLNAALAKPFLNYKLFTGNHTATSSFPLVQQNKPVWSKARIANLLSRGLNGRVISLATEKCYCPTEDCAEIAWRFLGIEKQKVELMYLGTDCDFFYPADSEELFQERANLRQELGFAEDEIVCVYTGKMTETKNPLILAQAIEKLREMGNKFSGIFIGNGVQSDLIQQNSFCKMLEFMPFYKLGAYYRASDIAVWPTNESTSMMDAAACGIPVIISDGVIYRKPVDGNGLVYKMNDHANLVESLLSLRDPHYRNQLGTVGASKMKTELSWETLAKRRLQDYKAAIAAR